jgi:AraC-like DNA-binding protein
MLEQRIAGLLLRQWQVGFNQLREPVVGRLIVGHDDRLIHADPWTQVQLLEDPSILPQLLQTLRIVVKQRYPSLTQSAMYDFASKVGERGYWVRFHHDRLGGVPTPEKAEHWYIELHPLEEAELPIIGPIDDERIARSVGYIHENFHKSPSLNQIAAAVHVSPFHFHRLFTKAVGISPKHYLQRKQLQVAKWMLRATREPIGSVAQKTGFSSHGHFTSTFHRLVGMSPSHYREQKC